MTNWFVDDNKLIDTNAEDDNLLAFHSLEDVRVSDTDDQRKQSLGWDCGFFTSAGLLNPEELSKVNKGFKNKKSNLATRKDAKRPTKIASCNSQDSNRSRSFGFCKTTCFTSPVIQKTIRHSNESSSSSKQRKLISSNAAIQTASFSDRPKGRIKSNLSPCVSTENSLKVGKVGSSGSKLKPITGLLSPKKLFMGVNKDFKKSSCSTLKEAKRSTVTTKTGGSQSNALSCKKTNTAAQDGKRLQSASLPKSMCFASPTIHKTVHRSYESSSSKNASKPIKTKVNPKNTKLVNSPSSVHRFPLSSTSTSPASSIDGDLRLSGLLSTRELFMINKGLKKSNLIPPQDAKRSKITTKTDGSRSNAARDSKPGGLPKYSTRFTSPTIQKTVHRACESSSKNLSKSVKRNVNSKSVKSVNHPSSAQHLPLSPSSTSPVSYIDGKFLLSTPVTPLNTIPVSNIKSQNYEERKLIRQYAIKPTGLRLPSPRIGFFDMEPGSMQDRFRYIENQLQTTDLSSVSTRNCLKVGNLPFTENNRANLSGHIRERLARFKRADNSFGKQYANI